MESVPIYRIIHVDNLDFILINGQIVCPNHHNSDANYISIGNNDIIEQRSSRNVPGIDDKTFKDYIAFYFGKRSIMLFNIHTGYGEVERVHQSNIIYLVSNTKSILLSEKEYFFTDGHAMQYPVTQFFYDLSYLSEVKLADANATNFSAKADLKNPGLKRRKQAEFHVLHDMELSLIDKIVVYNKSMKDLVKGKLEANSLSIPIEIDRSYYF